MNGRRTDAEESLVRITDLAGRARGTGFLADDCGTLITSHEAVDGLARLVLHAPGELTCVVGADSVVALPEYDLALVRTEGLTVPPLPVAAAERIESGKEVRLRAGRWHSGRIIGDVPVTYTATDRFHLLGTALELSLSGRSALRLGEEATGGPVFDAGTGAVLAVLGTALQADRRAAGFAIPLRAAALAAPGGPLAELLHRNSATVPAFGPDLNLAGALQLTATALGSVVTPRVWRDPVERPEIEREFARFLDGPPGEEAGGALVLGLVGDPGTGRTTELGALAARRARGAEPAPTIWLRGADLRAGDDSLRDALARALTAAGRIVTASAGPGGTFGDTSAATPEATAELARSMGRPLLVLLDGPEEMPPVLAHALPAWTSATVHWLRRTATRLIVACRPEHWETAGTLFPEDTLHRAGGPCAPPPAGPRALPPCSRLPRLAPGQAAEVRASYGIPPDAIAPDDAAHPLALRLLAEVRAALPDGTEGAGGTGEAAPDRWEVFSAYLDLVCLRIAVRLAAARRPQLRGPAVRRLAARVAGQVHEAARRCLGPGQGELEREAFEELFPWRTGWASAVLTEGLLVPAGTGYRFAHEEFADWLQGTHLDLDAALHALVHRWYEPEGPPAEAAVRLPSRAGGGPMPAPGGHVPPPPGSGKAAARAAAGKTRRKRGAAPAEPRPLPVPRHRIGPVLQSMLLLARRSGPTELSRRLSALVHAVETLSQRTADAEAKEEGAGRRLGDPSWWAAHLLGETLLRVPDATPYLGVLRLLAERTTARSVAVGGFDSEAAATLGGLAEFGPWFWLRLPIALADRLELLRILLPADAPPPGSLPPPRRAELDAGDASTAAAEAPAGAGRAPAIRTMPMPMSMPWTTAT
ncbi:serine protease, partial [Streptomyces sp. NPDC029704]|uniref:serine protease n=1 Tax=Streptomyces sp. NPDC029704 TaxID=3156920 RepID=UPI0033DC0702